MARVQVSDETWSAFRASLGTTPVSVGLGQLVEREVAARCRRAASDPDGVRLAVDDARIVVDELSSLIARLEGQGNGRASTAGASPPTAGVLFD
jgi:hypothetical protein